MVSILSPKVLSFLQQYLFYCPRNWPHRDPNTADFVLANPAWTPGGAFVPVHIPWNNLHGSYVVMCSSRWIGTSNLMDSPDYTKPPLKCDAKKTNDFSRAPRQRGLEARNKLGRKHPGKHQHQINLTLENLIHICVTVNKDLEHCSLGTSFRVHCSQLILFRNPHQYPNIHCGLL